MYSHMELLLDKLQQAEGSIDTRLIHLEEQLKEQLQLLAAEHKRASSKWMLPYIVLCSIVVLIALWGLKQQRTVAKLHKVY